MWADNKWFITAVVKTPFLLFKLLLIMSNHTFGDFENLPATVLNL